MNAFFSTFVQRFIFVVFIWCISFGFNYVATENGSVQYPRSEASDTIVNHELINAETTPQAPDASIDMETFRSSATNKEDVFELNGFEEYETVPIEFPIDICLMEINGTLYASCLQSQNRGRFNKTVLILFKRTGRNEYVTIFTHETNSAKSMDCLSMGLTGYIAIVNTVSEDEYHDITEGSPVFQVSNDRVNVVHYFGAPFQHSVYLRKYGPSMFLFQTFVTEHGHRKQMCPIFQWVDSTFSLLDKLPCTNAWRVEPFLINSDIFIAIANNRNEYGDTETYSLVYKFDIHRQRFKLAQKIKTFGATDLSFFHFISNMQNENFLIIANQYEDRIETDVSELDSVKCNAIIYHFNDEHFIPMQSIYFDTAIKQFLPVLSKNSEFVLLISLEDKATMTFQYNGWQFVESPIQFTGGSLDKGVSSLRTYTLNEEKLIVVANTNMYRDATNLFLPKYLKTVPASTVAFPEDFDAWYRDATEQLQKENLVDLFNKLREIQTVESLGGSKYKTKGLLRLTDTHISTIETNALNSPSLNFDRNQFMALIAAADEILEREAQSLKYPKLNDVQGLPQMNATHLTVDHLTFDNINGHSKDDLVYRSRNLNLQKLEVDEVVFLNAIKGYESILAKVEAQERQPKRLGRQANDEPLVVDNLQVDGLINNFSFKRLIEYTLKVSGKETQEIQGEITFDRVKANAVNIQQNEISNRKLDEIIQIKEKFYFINQEIRFTEPLLVNHLNVVDRINHISIKNGKIDILLRRVKGTQIITGEKLFDSVKLLSPIILRGNIRTHSLDKMKPTVTVDDEITVIGDFIIRGDVDVKEFIQANNLFGESRFYSVQRLIEDGLETSAENIDVAIQFSQPIKVDHTLNGTRIDGIKVESLVKLGMNDWQMISGRKSFVGDLKVKNGLCDAAEINGLNIQSLNDTILKRNGVNQTVAGSIQFKRIAAENTKVNLIKLGLHPMDRLLTKDTDQVITGNVRIIGNVLVSNGTGIILNRLNTKNRIFDVDLINILQDSIISQSPTVHFVKTKSFENITIGLLIIEGHFWQYGTSETILEHIELLRRGLILDGPITFTNAFNIKELRFTDFINEVAREDFGTAWLLSETNQVFTAPQIVEFVKVDYNFMLNNRINEWNLEYLYDQTIWNYDMKDVHFRHVQFEHISVEDSIILGGKLSGIRFPEDLILRTSDQIQVVESFMKFGADVSVHKNIEVIKNINGINLARMCELLSPQPESIYGLIVYGDAHFYHDPEIVYLNDELFSGLIETAWFVTDSLVDLSSSLFFGEAIFYSTINLTGVVNGWDLLQLRQRYFSLTAPQEIHSLVQFRGPVNFQNSLHASKFILKGLLKSAANPLGIAFDYLYANTLKRNSGINYINSPWKIKEIELLSDISGVQINNLNLNNDVIRYSSPGQNVIYAEKYFENVKIGHLNCKGSCSLQYVNMGEWISKAVLVYSDYIVQGTTYIENPLIPAINVLGTVNNQTFNSKTILRKSSEQIIPGNVYITNKPYQVATLTFSNIYLNYINSYNFPEFHDSLVLRQHRKELNVNINTNVKFLQALRVDDLHADVINNRNFSVLFTENNHLTENFRSKVKKLEFIRDEIAERVGMAARSKYLDHFVWSQTLHGISIERLSALKSTSENATVFVGLIMDSFTSSMEWYEWNTDTSKLTPISVDILHPPDRIILDFTVMDIVGKSLIIVYYKSLLTDQYSRMIYLFTNRAEPINQLLELPATNISELVTLRVMDKHCFAFYEKHSSNISMHDVTFNQHNRMEITKLPAPPIQNVVKIVAYETSALIAYENTDQTRLTFWHYSQDAEWTADEKIELTNVLSDFDAIRFNGNTYVAACFEGNDPPIVGGIRIYKQNNNTFDEIQTITSVEAPVQCKFSKISSQELLLFVLSNQSSGYVMIFKYQGVKGFQLHSDMNKSQAIQRNNSLQAKRFSLVENKQINLQLLIVNSESETRVIHSIFN